MNEHRECIAEIEALERRISRLEALLKLHQRFHSKGCPGLPECYVCKGELEYES